MKIVLIVATSLDGYIAQKREQNSTEWTSEADKKWFGKISKEIGTMIMGKPTYETIGFPLPERKTIVMTRDEKFPGKAIEEFAPNDEEKLYKTGDKTPGEIVASLQKSGLEKVAICGGARVYEAFLRDRLIDELYITVEPVFLGGGIKLMQVDEPENSGFPWYFEVIERIDISRKTTVWHLRMPQKTIESPILGMVGAVIDSVSR